MADILENIERARGYAGDLSADDLAADQQKFDAVLRRLQNASEASTRLRNEWPELAAEIEARYPAVPWRRLRDLGNRYRHGYDTIDADRIWEDLHGFVRDVERAVSEELALSQVHDASSPENPPSR